MAKIFYGHQINFENRGNFAVRIISVARFQTYQAQICSTDSDFFREITDPDKNITSPTKRAYVGVNYGTWKGIRKYADDKPIDSINLDDLDKLVVQEEILNNNPKSFLVIPKR